MSEVIADLHYRLSDSEGREFLASVAAQQRLTGTWEAWLEFVPLDGTGPLITPIETTQSNRAALEHWAEALEGTYVEGAFRRAVDASGDEYVSRLAARAMPFEPVPLNDVDLPNPFQLFENGREGMRTRLNALSRLILQNMIDTYGLNPAGKDLSWLSDRQMVTFIITAVETQIAMRRD
jgi:hypothetical protein